MKVKMSDEKTKIIETSRLLERTIHGYLKGGTIRRGNGSKKKP
jgi:hypothetical protein